MISPARFYELSALLPEGFNWGTALSPHHLEAILQTVASSVPGDSSVPVALRRAGSLRVFEGGYSFEAEPGSPLHELPLGRYALFVKPYEKPNENQERSIEQ